MSFFDRLEKLLTTPSYLECYLTGLRLTILLSLGAILIGLLLGILVAIVTIAPKTRGMKIPKAIASAYVTIIRGTPMALQLFLMSYVIFAIRGFPREVVAILAFGINSGAYVSESIRAGIQSVDYGQFEAGRALGLSRGVTLKEIVVPQAIKNVLPSIGNELIALIKETSIVSMIGMYDLTMAAKIVGAGNNLASYLLPMTVAALFYLAIVYFLTFLIKRLERRLHKGDRRPRSL